MQPALIEATCLPAAMCGRLFPHFVTPASSPPPRELPVSPGPVETTIPSLTSWLGQALVLAFLGSKKTQIQNGRISTQLPPFPLSPFRLPHDSASLIFLLLWNLFPFSHLFALSLFLLSRELYLWQIGDSGGRAFPLSLLFRQFKKNRSHLLFRFPFLPRVPLEGPLIFFFIPVFARSPGDF